MHPSGSATIKSHRSGRSLWSDKTRNFHKQSWGNSEVKDAREDSTGLVQIYLRTEAIVRDMNGSQQRWESYFCVVLQKWVMWWCHVVFYNFTPLLSKSMWKCTCPQSVSSCARALIAHDIKSVVQDRSIREQHSCKESESEKSPVILPKHVIEEIQERGGMAQSVNLV